MSVFVSIYDTLRAPVVRAVRTGVQAFLGVYIAGTLGAGTFAEIADRGVLEAAAVAGILAAVTFIWNVLEGVTKAPIPKD